MAKLTPRRWHAKTHLPKLLHFKLIRWMPPNIRRVKQNMDGSANPQAAAAMGLHLLFLAKLNLITATAGGGASPLVAGLLVWPFVLRLSFSIRPLHQAYTDLAHASRLFFFQMGQIAFSNGSTTAGPGVGNGDSSRTRWARALRLVYRRFTDARRSPMSDSDEENLRAVSLIAL
ncbi:hypothetical protein C3L33_08684, partial [Rhododendron williamsianum]